MKNDFGGIFDKEISYIRRIEASEIKIIFFSEDLLRAIIEMPSFLDPHLAKTVESKKRIKNWCVDVLMGKKNIRYQGKLAFLKKRLTPNETPKPLTPP